MYGLDLFSGIGGITKALDGYVRPVAYCEIDAFCRGVLLSRMSEGKLPSAPIWDDVTTLCGHMVPDVDIIYGGFPCQDISCAGRGGGLGGKRSGLFFEIVRLAEEIKPQFLFLENVANIRSKGLNLVIKEVDRLGYDCRWGILSASDVGAPHRRDRWWLLAHRNSGSRSTEFRIKQKERTKIIDSSGAAELAHTDDKGLQRRNSEILQECSREQPIGSSRAPMADPKSGRTRIIQNTGITEGPQRGNDLLGIGGGLSAGAGWWESEPNVGRVANGVPKRVDRLKGLGNAVVPAQAREAFEKLMGLK